MLRGGNLATRITALLLVGFVLLQIFLFAVMTLPQRSTLLRPYNMPPPAQIGAMADSIEAAPPGQRQTLLAVFNGSLFTVSLLDRMPPADMTADADDLRAMQRAYAAALPGRRVVTEGGEGAISRIIRRRPGPMRHLSPVGLIVSLKQGGALRVDSRPSMMVRDYMRSRTLMGLIGVLAVLGALTLAIRATTRPLVRMSDGVRRFARRLDAPDLPVEGAHEVRELSIAFNEMKARIGALIGERTRILAAIAHDMRTYLTRLRLRAELIDDAEQRAKAAQDLDEMALLLDDTLLFARSDGGAPGSPVRIDLAAELSGIVEQHVEMGDAVTFDRRSEGHIMADRLALRRMLGNLIDNGLRYGSTVKVALCPGDGGCMIVVEDDGPGVPPETLARLGAPYARIDPSRDRASGGAGLGLAIVRALAGQMGATLEIVNRVPHGLSVTIGFSAVEPEN